MNDFKRQPRSLCWLMALFMAFFLAGCGSGGGGDGVSVGVGLGVGPDSGGSGIQAVSPEPVPGALDAIPPGTVPSGTVLPSPSTPGTNMSGTGTSGTGTSGTNPSGTSSGPTVLSSNPTNGATNVTVGTIGSGNVVMPRAISATFSEAMNPASIASPASSFTLKETVSGNGVAGSVGMNAANTMATFTPSAVLASNMQFTAIVTSAATNTAGTALVGNYAWSFTTGSQIGQAPINLGTAASFMVLGGTSITNFSTATNPTRVNGQLGIDPGSASSVTGFTESNSPGTGIIVTNAGGIQTGVVVSQARTDLQGALNEASVRSSHQILVGVDLASFVVNGGSPGVYPPGLYSSVSTLTLTSGNMTLDAQGDPDAVWVFKAGSQFEVGDTRQVLLLNGAKAGNIFWRLGSSASIGDQVRFKGNILTGSSLTLGSPSANGITVDGRVLSVSGLNLYAATINAPAP